MINDSLEQGFACCCTSPGQQNDATTLVDSHNSEFAGKNIPLSTTSEQRSFSSPSSPGSTAPSETPPGQISQGFASSGQHDCCTSVLEYKH